MKEVTMDDYKQLRKDFEEYTDRAEQHEFPLLFALDMKMQNTAENFEKYSQKELRAMCRVVLKVIGKDYSEYKES